MTPESETSTWYHWGMVRNFQTEDRGLTFRIRDGQAAVFAEDTEILEAQQENILRRPDRELLNFKIDAGGVNARRIIEREVARQGRSNVQPDGETGALARPTAAPKGAVEIERLRHR